METNPNSQVNRESNSALYSQLEEIIREQIDTGILTTGEPIPSERELSRVYGLSRMTVRRAIDRLVVTGLLTRISGKGTYVSKPKINFRALTLAGLREQSLKMGRESQSQLMSIEKVLAYGSMVSKLEIEPDSPVYKIERVFFSDNIPVSLHQSIIPCSLVPDLTDVDLRNESLYMVLKTKYGINISRASETLESTLATSRESLMLGVPVGSPMLLLRISVFNENDQPVEYVKVVFRGDRVQLSLVV